MIGILGGVSPLKVRQKSRGGKHAKSATATSKRRGGFAPSKGKRGAGGRNVGGYNVRTRFKADPVWVAPPSGGTIGGDIVRSILGGGDSGSDPMATKKWTDPVTGGTTTEKREKERSSYRESWDAMEDKDGGKYNPRNKKIILTIKNMKQKL